MKNIILLITDTYRYDNLLSRSPYAVRTPQLDRFIAERATAIEGCYVSSFPTIPHRTDLATGVLGWPHYGWQAIDLSGPNQAAKMLSAEGYSTQLICDCPHLFKARFDLAFDAAYHLRGQEGDRHLLHLNDPIEEVTPANKTRPGPQISGHSLPDIHSWTNRSPKYEGQMFSARTGQTAVRWLEENYQSGPLFLWVDFFDPHEPWDAPEYMVRRYDPDYDGAPMVHPNYGRSDVYTEAELRNLQSHYAAEAELVDRWIGRVIEKVEDLQIWENSLLVVTTDHGMSIGEHRRTGKSNIHEGDPRYWPLYPEVSHIPFLIAGGDIPRGKSIDVFMQPPDILPTLAELAGVALNPPKPFEGYSYADVVLKDAPAPREIAVSGCNIKSETGGVPRKATTPFVTTDRWGYAPIGAYGRREIYDLKVDPYAENDLSASHGDQMETVHTMFIDHLRKHKASEQAVALWTEVSEGEGKWAIDYD